MWCERVVESLASELLNMFIFALFFLVWYPVQELFTKRKNFAPKYLVVKET